MNISEIRKEIDAIDEEIRTLLMKRLDCSEQVAQTKMQAAASEGKPSEITIFRADREEEILKRLFSCCQENHGNKSNVSIWNNF